MGRGCWTRAGRGGSFELYALEIGALIRCEIRETAGVWVAHNGRFIVGEFGSIEDAAKRLAQGVNDDMRQANEAWEKFRVAPDIARRLRRY